MNRRYFNFRNVLAQKIYGTDYGYLTDGQRRFIKEIVQQFVDHADKNIDALRVVSLQTTRPVDLPNLLDDDGNPLLSCESNPVDGDQKLPEEIRLRIYEIFGEFKSEHDTVNSKRDIEAMRAMENLFTTHRQAAVREARIEELRWAKTQFTGLEKSHVGNSSYTRGTAFKNYAVQFWNTRSAKIRGKFVERIAHLCEGNNDE